VVLPVSVGATLASQIDRLERSCERLRQLQESGLQWVYRCLSA
jgi:hypothetical protein